MRETYLDNAATTPLAPEVFRAMQPWLTETFGNPSSRHPRGVRASEALDRARRQVARVFGARPADVVFTSGGTEANNLAVIGIARARESAGKHVVVGPTEHPCVRNAVDVLAELGFEVEEARLDEGGALDLEHLAGRLRADTVLVTVMVANNEFGTVYPVREVARLVRARSPRAAVHVDAVQAFGKLDCSLDTLEVDSLAISGHKFHGPMGTGALVLREGVEVRPLLFGGGQEQGRRSGTENLPGIIGLGEAVRLADERCEETARITGSARARLAAGAARLPGVRVVQAGTSFLPSVLTLVVSGPPADVWMNHLDARGVLVSTGSACSAKKKAISPALLAMGLDEDEARHVLRFSFAHTTSDADVDRALSALEAVCAELRAIRS